MGPSGEEFDDFVDPERDDLWNFVPARKLKQDPVPPGSHRGQAAFRPAPESVQPPWKRSQGRKTFDDNAIVRSSNNMHGLTPVRLSEPPGRRYGTKYGTAIMLAGVAMAAGILGHALPSGSLIPLLQPSRQFDRPGTSEKAVEQLNVGAQS